jgi:DNA-binding LytR/AlgR family response regulator
MNICICDDDILLAVKLKKMIEQAASDLKIKVEVYMAEKGEDMLEYAAKTDAVFLDIDLPEKSGFEIGKILKEKNPDIIIVMESGHNEMMRESIHLGVKDFLTKPYTEEDVKTSMKIIQDKLALERKVTVYEKRNEYIIRQKDIYKIEAYNGYVYIYVKNKIFRKDVSLKKMTDELDARFFFQTDRKTVVNLSHTDSYDKGSIVVNGEEMKISRDRKKAFEKMWMEYDLKYKK